MCAPVGEKPSLLVGIENARLTRLAICIPTELMENARMRPMSRAALLVLSSLAFVACSKGEEGPADSAAVNSSQAPATAPADSTATGLGDRQFLAEMIDHHEGMVQMAYATRGKTSEPDARKDADRLHQTQSAERDSMVAMLKRDFATEHQPKVMPGNQAMIDSIANLRGRFLAKGFYEMTVQHHKEGIQMIDRYLPSLQNAQVKQMAEKMKAEQQQEIEEFTKKGETKGPVDPRAEH